MKRKSTALFFLVLALAVIGFIVTGIKGVDKKSVPTQDSKVRLSSTTLIPQLKVCVSDSAPMNCINAFFSKGSSKYYTADLVNQLYLYRKAEPKATEYCHDIALTIGFNAWSEFKDPLKALKAGTPVCASGYLHGLQEGIGNDKTLSESQMMSNLHAICDNLTGSEGERSSMFKVCYHGIGHAINKRVGFDAPAGYDICASLPSTRPSTPDKYEQAYTQRELCAEGVSMRYFETLTTKSESFVNEVDPGKSSTNIFTNPYGICDKVSDSSIRYACFEYATRSFIHSSKSYKKVVTLCNYYNDSDQLPCFFGLSRELAYSPGTKSLENVKDYCLKASSPDAAYFCAQNAILNRITIDNDIRTPVEVCKALEKNAVTEKVCAKVSISLKLTQSENSRNF